MKLPTIALPFLLAGCSTPSVAPVQPVLIPPVPLLSLRLSGRTVAPPPSSGLSLTWTIVPGMSDAPFQLVQQSNDLTNWQDAGTLPWGMGDYSMLVSNAVPMTFYRVIPANSIAVVTNLWVTNTP